MKRMKVVRIFVEGHFSVNELLAGFQFALDDDHVTSYSHILIDVTKSEELPPAEIIEQIAAILCRNRERFSCRLAILVSKVVRYGIARQLSTMLDNKNINAEPFYNQKEAVDWLEGKSV